MINYRDALKIIEQIAAGHLVTDENIKLVHSLGRILSNDILSPELVPSFTNSSMDGFAVYASDTKNASSDKPIKIRVNGLVAAGDLSAFKEYADQGNQIAVEIMTGAPVPRGGLDAVVKIEDVQVERNDDGTVHSISIFKPSSTGDNIRPIGTDYKVDQLVISKGTRISPEHILAASSLGISNVQVKNWPRIAIISTGSELVSPETYKLEPGLIRNSTGPFLVAALQRIGIDAKYLGIVSDDPSIYKKTLEAAIQEGAEIILSTGAVSMGKFDFVTDLLVEMGAKIHFHKSSIRPGKPILFAEFGGKFNNTILFGIPGNPVSTAVGLRFFVEPFIRKTMDLPSEKPIQIKLDKDVSKPDGLRCFFKGRTKIIKNELSVDALRGQASYMVSSLIEANCWVVLPEENVSVRSETMVDVYALNNSFELGILS